ncbi:hypothetical protein JOF53_006499 [Crossiella equi]|uniref:Uncharacterized protein n=1 Tax=Crossiella equi TaxID=130796 RepID=A0ABS5AML2_9PSEU|nr:hypothetical protein [Crossiella equi]MBP2477627.1 hypothetical protein [Crossiella equi]
MSENPDIDRIQTLFRDLENISTAAVEDLVGPRARMENLTGMLEALARIVGPRGSQVCIEVKAEVEAAQVDLNHAVANLCLVFHDLPRAKRTVGEEIVSLRAASLEFDPPPGLSPVGSSGDERRAEEAQEGQP